MMELELDRSPSVDQALTRARTALLKKQHADGSWVGEVELNPGPTAQVVMLHAVLRRALDPLLSERGLRYIMRTQNDDGGWSPHAGAVSEVSLTCECYVAMRLSGQAPDAPAVRRARERIAKLGGPTAANPWTQLYLSVLGVLPWGSVRKVPIEVLLTPKWLPVGLEDLSYWVKVITVPMALLGSYPKPEPVTLASTLRGELAPELKESGARIPRPLAPAARARAWRAIESFTEASGDFGGNTCTAMNVLMALHLEGRTHEPLFEAGLQAMLRYGFKCVDEWHVQCCQSHVWDTGFAMMALPPAREKRAATWLRERQILTVRGDWARNVSAAPGGWCFGDRHDRFPVTDCTALALLALERHEPGFSTSLSAERGLAWLLGMQHESGGWSAYEKYHRGQWLNKVIRFKDIDNALVDIPKADVSAKVLEALARFRSHSSLGKRIEDSLVAGRKFLMSTRDERGLWKGNYGVNYLYGTSFACKALRAIDGAASTAWSAPAREFFLHSQNADGGWGEVEASYRDASLAGHGDSSVVQTSWALMGLAACDDGSAWVRDALVRGSRFLIGRQNENGLWEEPGFVGTVFPGAVYFRYELYAAYFPIMALDAIKS